MVLQSSEVLGGTDSLEGFPRTQSGEDTTRHRQHHNSTFIPLGLNPETWIEICKELTIPHFSHTKRLDLIYQKQIPIIYGEVVKPVLSCSSLFCEQEFDYGEHTSRLNPYRCTRCLQDILLYDTRLDILVCSYCGCTEVFDQCYGYVVNTRIQNVSRKFSPDFHKRLTHFRYWLRRLQGKERNRITSGVIHQVKSHLKRLKVKGIHYWTVRNALRYLKLQKYYPHTVSIMAIIRGKPLFDLKAQHENALVDMFLSMQHCFGDLQGKRVNMLSYPYVIKKLCELKGWTHVSKVIPTLKTHGRIVNQDEMWKQICTLQKWKFIPTAQWSSLETRGQDSRPR